jgi:hypothetical protein
MNWMLDNFPLHNPLKEKVTHIATIGVASLL